MVNGVVLGFLSYAFFAWGDASVKAVGPALGVFEIGFFSALFSAAALGLFGRPASERWRDLFRMRRPGLVLLRTASGLSAGLFGIVAFTTVPFAEAYAILFLAPLLVTLMSIVVLGERIGWRRWLAVAIGLAGVFLVVRPGFHALEVGHLAAAMAALAAATSVTVLRKIGNTERRTSLIGVVTLGAIVFNGAMMAPTFAWPEPRQFLYLALSGTLGGLGHLFLLGATRLAPANRVAPAQYSQIVWAVVIGVIFYAEYPDLLALGGIALIGCSGLFTLMREERVSGWRRRMPLIRNRP
jgi:S-adenosylmethionine uptake transporter